MNICRESKYVTNRTKKYHNDKMSRFEELMTKLYLNTVKLKEFNEVIISLNIGLNSSLPI